MIANGTGRLKAASILLVSAFLAAFVVTGACSRKETTEQKAPNAVPKNDTERKEKQHEGLVKLSPESVKTAGIETRKAVTENLSGLIGVTAVLELNADRVSRVNPRVAGRCVNVKASLGDRVRSGQALAQIDSVEGNQAWSDYLKAKARLELAARSSKREETLFEKKVSPEKDLLKARQELSEAEADLLLARQRFGLLGVDMKTIETNANGGNHARAFIPVTTPLSGVVVEKTVTQGEMVTPEKTLFTVADLSTLWLMIDLYERDIPRVKTGARIKLTVPTYPGKEFRGRISYIGDVVDEKSRTVKGRVTIENKEGLLKPGMFASASIDSAGEAKSAKVIAVPEEAVFMDGPQRYVFIDQGNGTFMAREISVGSASAGKIEIKDGLKEGELVAVKGVFALKSELKKESLEAE